MANIVYYEDIQLVDNVKLIAGTSSDIQIYSDNSNSILDFYNLSNVIFRQHFLDGDMTFQCDDGSGGVTTYFKLNGGNEDIDFSKSPHLLDSVTLKIGSASGGDLQLYHNGSHSLISNQTGNLYIRNQTNDGDIVLQADDGSGGDTTYFYLDGSSTQVKYDVNLKIHDNKKLIAGDADDLQIYHDSSHSIIKADGTGNLILRQDAADADIVFKSDDGSGGSAEYFRVDGGIAMNVVSKAMLFTDSVRADFGSSNDLRIYHNGTNSNIENFTGTLQIIQNLDDGDISFKSDDGSGGTAEYFRVDGGTEEIIVSKKMQFTDNVKAVFGTGEDLDIFHDGTDSTIDNAVGDLIISNNANDKDIIFKSDTGAGGLATYFRLDGSDVVTLFSKDTRHIDSVAASFGNSNDLKIQHNGTDNFIDSYTGNLNIRNHNADKDIIFQADGGSGSAVEYLRLDGSQVAIRMKRLTKWDDNIKATWGDDLDVQIYSDNTTAYIEMPNLSNFIIGDSTTYNDPNIALVRVGALTGTKSMEEDWMGMYTSANSGLSYMTSSGSIKFNTTNSGVAVTGSLTATGDVEDRDIPCVLTSHFSDDSSTTSYLFVPFNNNSESSSNQYYNYFAAPQAGKVVSIMLMHVSGSMSSSFTTQLRVAKNGSTANTSGELTPSNGTSDGSYVEYAPGTVFAKGDRLQFSYQKSAGSKYWRGATATIVIELTDYDI